MKEVFVRGKPSETGFSVATTLGINNKKLVKGVLGLEIEVEGNKFPKPPGYEGAHNPVPMPDLEGWSYVHDGSLRGEDNAEYLLTKPIPFDDLDAKLGALWGAFEKAGSVIEDSNRTSVHVHLNCQGFFLDRLTTFIALYFTFEELLTEWCGEHRVGNLFCMRAIDAPAIISQMRRFIRSDGQAKLHDHHHYAALNGNALHKYGSLEIRTLRGVTDPNVIRDWVRVIRRLYELSETIRDPREVCAMFSAQGPTSFMSSILGETEGIIRKGISLTEEEITESLYTGVRLAQDICYCRDWDKFKGIELQPDPFGREAAKIAKKMTGVTISVAEIDELLDEDDDDAYPEPMPEYDTAPPPVNAPDSAWASYWSNAVNGG